MDTAYPSQITCILIEIGSGERSYVDKLLPLVYVEFRSMASLYLKMATAGHTFQPTDLVHEANLKLVDQKKVNKNHLESIRRATDIYSDVAIFCQKESKMSRKLPNYAASLMGVTWIKCSQLNNPL